MHDLAIADVYAALKNYHEHPEEMVAVRERRSDREAAARDAGARTVAELRAEGDEERSEDSG